MTCKDCAHYEVCLLGACVDGKTGVCMNFKNKADFIEVVRCKDCEHAIELDKHCEINRLYRHCELLRGEETINVWHKYKKYYKDYSIVAPEDFCSYGLRKECDGE